MKTFTWYPDIDSGQSCKPNVTTTKFGDGYEQRVAVGLNSAPMKWSLNFDRDRTEALEILAFLREHNGVTAFNWTNPLQESGKYVCREWETSQNKGTMKVSCDFEQVFEY